MAIEAGMLVGEFQVEEMIGKGGMASVYRAIQLRLQRPVALKVLSPALAADEQFVQRFQLEGVNAARLEHPNIVPVYAAGEDAGNVYLAMKLINGDTLKGVIQERRVLDPDQTFAVLVPVGHALDYAHRLGFVHRDVKPANILVTHDGHVYLSDFGLTKAVGQTSITSTGQWMGTPEYMPPEQSRGEQVDQRADLYSFACVAFECMAGGAPFTGDNPVALIMAHATHPVPSATAYNLSLPPGVDAVFVRALAKHPEERYGTAIDLLEALKAAVDERRLTANAEPADDVRHFGPRATPIPAASPPAAPPPAAVQPVMQPPPQVTPVPMTPQGTSTQCPVCFGRLAVGYSFCGDCGTRISWCGHCSGPAVAGDRFCQHCGSTI